MRRGLWVVPQATQPHRVELGLFECGGERVECVTVGGGGVQEPAPLLGLVVLFLRERQIAAGPLHLLREGAHRGGERLRFEISEDPLAVADRLDVSERQVEERRQLVLVAAGDDRLDDLVEVQVGEAVRLLRRVEDGLAGREEDAAERVGRRGRVVQLRVESFGARHRLPSRLLRR